MAASIGLQNQDRVKRFTRNFQENKKIEETTSVLYTLGRHIAVSFYDHIKGTVCFMRVGILAQKNTRVVCRCEACLCWVSHDLSLCRPSLRCAQWLYICAWTPTGNYINSRKKLEKEAMHIPHEHNWLDHSNSGFISRTTWPIKQEMLKQKLLCTPATLKPKACILIYICIYIYFLAKLFNI